MLDLKQLENDMAKITDNLRNGLTNNLQNYDINIKLTYDELSKKVNVLQNGMVIKSVDYSNEANCAAADKELTSYLQLLSNEFRGM
ncbi:hypothetical protein [Succinivibrio dextrinosolvens]|uniref:hypothetical protein n=1 Tax=Succinivibrio dextrinosolvens TaxID=83771 RepID=UPI00241EC0A7|nr:hypothetical protein [Succinivibrio dextrinosolvens]MBE6422817.1 hypothetical protein [Succinivibrio dextrinosolvens]